MSCNLALLCVPSVPAVSVQLFIPEFPELIKYSDLGIRAGLVAEDNVVLSVTPTSITLKQLSGQSGSQVACMHGAPGQPRLDILHGAWAL